MATSARFSCPTCGALSASFILYEAGEPAASKRFMFAEAAEDTATARLVYEPPDGAGVRIVGDNELTDTARGAEGWIRCAAQGISGPRPENLSSQSCSRSIEGLGRIEVFERRRKYPFGTGSARAISSNTPFSASLRASSASDAMPLASFASRTRSSSYSLCEPLPLNWRDSFV